MIRVCIMIIVIFTTKDSLMSTGLLVAVMKFVLHCCRVPVTVIKPASVVKGPATAPGQTQAGAPAAALDALRVPGMPGSIYDIQQDSNTADVVRVIGEVLVWTHELLLCTAQHCTAQHSTARHSKAQHSTEQPIIAASVRKQQCLFMAPVVFQVGCPPDT